jgi:hypothetical protein
MPSGGHLKQVFRGVLRLQVIYNMSVSDVMSGKFADIPALSSLSLDDAFEFARVAYETDQYYLAVVWLKEVVNMYKEDEATFALRNAMSLLSSAYLKVTIDDSVVTFKLNLFKSSKNTITNEHILYNT